MSPRKYRLHDGQKGAALAVRVTPKASQNQITEITHDGTVKIHITAVPEDGKANEELIKFLSDVLGVPKSRIEVVAGASGRDKLVSVLDMDAVTLHEKIVKHLG